jgi:tRNA-specific 2-thiouridylase
MKTVTNNSLKVFVGLSGGVDSSLAAALLVEQGYEVTGVYMKNWTADTPGTKCPWAEDLADAKRVAVQLGIPFKVYDFQAKYKQKVVDYMLREYQAGRTPNPDIMCNQEVKFKLFLDCALADGADLIATGHYAQVADGQLLRAADENKDQTYFLYRVTAAALQKTLFPIGHLTKPEVRREAARRGLVNAARRESMGICFVGNVGIREFLAQYIKTHPGDIIDQQTGAVVGRHDGAIFYTLGQRHGLAAGGGLPYYVVGKDMKMNKVYVSRDLNGQNFWRKELQLTDVVWRGEINEQTVYKLRLRHRAPLVDCRVKDNLTIYLNQPERAVAPGQSAVLYHGAVCLGGGIVK